MAMHHLFGGGTAYRYAPHIEVGAPGTGKTARLLDKICKDRGFKSVLHLTARADPEWSTMKTNEDVAARLRGIYEEFQDEKNIIYMSCALADYKPLSPLYERIHSRQRNEIQIDLRAAPKIIRDIRATRERKKIFVVGFKQVHLTQEGSVWESEAKMAAMELIKEASVNLVLVNDSHPAHKGRSRIITPEGGVYGIGLERYDILAMLIDMANQRSGLTFTRSNVLGGTDQLIDWRSKEVPAGFRKIINHLIKKGAYRNPLGGDGPTPGHFAFRAAEHSMSKPRVVTTIRGTDFRKLVGEGETKLVAMTWSPSDRNAVTTYGAKPSVGGQSQRYIFDKFPDYDWIIHFHAKVQKFGQGIETMPQAPFECGSHECGMNTAVGLLKGEWHFNSEKSCRIVQLDNHGPNILCKKDTDPEHVINLIDSYFDWTE